MVIFVLVLSFSCNALNQAMWNWDCTIEIKQNINALCTPIKYIQDALFSTNVSMPNHYAWLWQVVAVMVTFSRLIALKCNVFWKVCEWRLLPDNTFHDSTNGCAFNTVTFFGHIQNKDFTTLLRHSTRLFIPATSEQIIIFALVMLVHDALRFKRKSISTSEI